MGEVLKKLPVVLGPPIVTIAAYIEEYSHVVENAGILDATYLDNLLTEIYKQSLFLNSPLITKVFLANGGDISLLVSFSVIQKKLRTISEEMFEKKQVFYKIPDHEELIKELKEFIQKTSHSD